MTRSDRREFLAEVGAGVTAALVGPALAAELGLSDVRADDSKLPALDRLSALLQETPKDKLLPVVKDQLDRGTSLKSLVAAAALANAHAFAGQDYDGYHTFMALAPAFTIAEEMPERERPLPVFKVLYRNATLINGAHKERTNLLGEHEHIALSKQPDRDMLQAARAQKIDEADRVFVSMTARKSAEEAYEDVQPLVQDIMNVHNVVLAWRSWEILDFVGKDRARTMLRQSVRHRAHYTPANSTSPEAQWLANNLGPILERHGLLGKAPGTRQADKATVERLARTIYSGKRTDAPEAAAALLGDGIAPDSVAEATVLAATMLVLGDKGRTKAWPGKPVGSCHGDSVGVHASDAANAWRRIAGVTGARNTFASLIAGAYHTAGQSGTQMAKLWPSAEELEKVSSKDATTLLGALDEAVRGGDQARACAVVGRYAQLGCDAKPVFAVLRKYAVSEDGALHAEKYYRTASDEFRRARQEFRWMHLTALARVTASTFGKPAPGLEDARKVFKA
ncbi:MAG: hypothetical protein U0797_26610 [Gemmataceae bacterium]